MTRVVGLLALVGLLAWPPQAIAAQATGPGGAEVAHFDREIIALMQKHGVPGGTIAVARNGRLVVSRGYGIADRDAARPVLPDTPFRIASLTKPLAAIAALILVDKGRLTLDRPVAPILHGAFGDGVLPAEGRLAAITIRHLMQHTAGWGPRENPRGGGMEPSEFANLRANAVGDFDDHFVRLRAAWSTQPVTEPGARHAYSTFGACTLGAVLERIEGKPMDEIWHERVFRPAGVKRFGLAAAHASEPGPIEGEARYYDPPGSPSLQVSRQARSMTVTRPEGYWSPRKAGGCLSGGRLVLSAPDYLRVLTSAGGRRAPALLSPASRNLLFDAASPVVIEGARRMTHGLMQVRDAAGDTWWHTGGMPGTATYYSRSGAVEWVAFFNLQPQDRAFYGELNSAMWRAVRAVRVWPVADSF